MDLPFAADCKVSYGRIGYDCQKCSWQDIYFIGYENGAGRTNINLCLYVQKEALNSVSLLLTFISKLGELGVHPTGVSWRRPLQFRPKSVKHGGV